MTNFTDDGIITYKADSWIDDKELAERETSMVKDWLDINILTKKRNYTYCHL